LTVSPQGAEDAKDAEEKQIGRYQKKLSRLESVVCPILCILAFGMRGVSRLAETLSIEKGSGFVADI
jgi:hypothetical protein